MKVICNRDNPALLKLLIASNLGRVPVTWEFVRVESWKPVGIRRLPILELDDGTRVFSSNAAACLLFKENENISEKVRFWLEWDSILLQPALFNFNVEKARESVLVKLLDKIECSLKNSNFLVNNEVTLADYMLWASLFGVLNLKAVTSEYLKEKTKTLKWFDEIRKLGPVQEAEKQWSSNSTGADVIKAFSDATWFPSNNKENMNVEVEIPGISSSELERVIKAWTVDSSSRPKLQVPTAPVLPKKGKKNILITSALPYVNNVPHLGNIIGCVLSGDVFARYCRLRNWNTLYIAGTDEYGTATETKALEEKLTPQQICDKYFKIHKEIYSWFNIAFDHFGRTTTVQQKEITQELFWDVYNKQYTLTESMEQLHCEACDRFLADRFVEGTCPKCKYEDARGDQCDGCGQLINAVELIKPRCKLCNNMPIIKSSDQIFLDLPKIEKKLQNWIEKTSENWTHNARSITNTWLKDGLKSRCITRDLKWGTPVPLKGFENKVFYVWFDAPIGYISITACYTKEWRKWWQPSQDTPVTYYEFMAKDNVPFHSVMFPATLLAIDKGYKLVDHIMATEYLNYEDGKFSKSRGIGVFGTDAKSTGLCSDIFRFYLLYVRPESQDTSFSWEDLASKHNNELLNNIGNFVNRALVFTENFFKGIIPKMTLNNDDYTLLAFITRELQSYNNVLEKGKLKDGIKYMLNISRLGNQYMQSSKPWVLIKGSEEDKCRASAVVGVLCNVAALLGITMHPYMPNISKIMLEQMNFPLDMVVLTNEFNILLPEGHKIGKPSPLFAKIETSTVDALKSKFSGKRKSTNSNQASHTDTVTLKSYTSIKYVEEMEKAVTEQGNLVRQLKSSGAEKSAWLPHVEVLKDMKKHLEELKKANDISNGDSTNNYKSVNSVQQMEAIVTEQGNKVRQMKSNNVEKSVWLPHVDVLKDMKSHLENLKKLHLGNDESLKHAQNGVQNENTVSRKSKKKKDAKISQ